jgi:hypothetical protein
MILKINSDSGASLPRNDACITGYREARSKAEKFKE